MHCPFCNHDETQVVRPGNRTKVTWCAGAAAACIATSASPPMSRVELVMPAVVKKDGARVEFETEKLRASMMLALRKRPVSVEQIDAALERIRDKTAGQRRTRTAQQPPG